MGKMMRRHREDSENSPPVPEKLPDGLRKTDDDGAHAEPRIVTLRHDLEDK